MKPIVTFTFDDGTEDHYTHAAPILEKYGYRGIFNISTAFIGGHSDLGFNCLTREQIKDLYARGHEIASHTVHHVNMRNLWMREGAKACEVELLKSYDDIKSVVGVAPDYFCYPYNRGCPMVSRISRKIGMEPFNPIGRPNLGAYMWPTDENEIRLKLECMLFNGNRHRDLMFHGVVHGGGWNWFERSEDFERIVAIIKELECAGRLEVRKYSEAHSRRSGFLFNVFDWMVCQIWPIAYRVHLLMKGRKE